MMMRVGLPIAVASVLGLFSANCGSNDSGQIGANPDGGVCESCIAFVGGVLFDGSEARAGTLVIDGERIVELLPPEAREQGLVCNVHDVRCTPSCAFPNNAGCPTGSTCVTTGGSTPSDYCRVGDACALLAQDCESADLSGRLQLFGCERICRSGDRLLHVKAQGEASGCGYV
jgi:hypothetical protein